MSVVSLRVDRLGAGLAVAALLGLLPAVGRTHGTEPPSVDLGHISLGADGASAPLRDGGRAALTLDPSLQRFAQRLLAAAHPRRGAIILAEARTGKILVWAGTPHAVGSSRGVLEGHQAPAASLFKLVTSAALLEGHLPLGERVCYLGGEHDILPEQLSAPEGDERRCSSFGQALGHSRNAVFAQLALRHLEPGSLTATAARLGFDQAVPFDVPVRMGTLRVPGDPLGFARAAAGFVGSTLSPLGALQLSYTIAAGGRLPRLRIVKPAEAAEGTARREIVRRALESHTATTLARMMEVTVTRGTAHEAFHDAAERPYLGRLGVAGKTGTLRHAGASSTTTWFTGFVPSRAPRVVVSVLLENDTVWRRKAHAVARDVLREYLASKGYRGVTHPPDNAAP